MPLTNPAKPRQTPSRETVFDSAKTFENLVAAYKGMARWRGFSNHHFRGELACLKTHALRFAWRGLQTPRSSPDATRNHRVPCHPTGDDLHGIELEIVKAVTSTGTSDALRALSGGKEATANERDIHKPTATTEALWKHSPAISQAGAPSTARSTGDNPPRRHRLSSRHPSGSPGAWPAYSPRPDLRSNERGNLAC